MITSGWSRDTIVAASSKRISKHDESESNRSQRSVHRFLQIPAKMPTANCGPFNTSIDNDLNELSYRAGTIRYDSIRCGKMPIDSEQNKRIALAFRSNFERSMKLWEAVSRMPRIRIGDRLPSLTLYEALPSNRTNILDLVADKRAIVFGVPGAFVPGCSKVHLRGFIEKSADLRYLGFQEIICVSVNDPFVVSAWGNIKGAEDKFTSNDPIARRLHADFETQVRMLADPTGSYTKAIGMDIDIPELGGTRSRRYSMATVNGVVKELFVDSPNAKLVCLQQDGVPTYCT